MNRKYAKIEIICTFCLRRKKIYPCEKKDRNFCSKKCWYKYSKTQSQKFYLCDWCKNNFLAYKSMQENNKNHFCSIKCSQLNKVGKKISEEQKVKISLANQEFFITKDFLIKNYINKKRAILQDVANLAGCKVCTIRKWLKKYNLQAKHSFKFLPNYNVINEDLKKYAEKAKRFYGRKCMFCGYAKFVEAHTIISKSNNGSRKLDNLIVVCPNHHKECQFGIISIEEQLKKIVEYKEKVQHSE